MNEIVNTILDEVIKDLKYADEFSEKMSKERYPSDYQHQLYVEIGYLKGVMNVCKIKLDSLKYVYGINIPSAETKKIED